MSVRVSANSETNMSDKTYYSIGKVRLGAEIHSHNAYRVTRNADLFPYQ